MNKLIQKQAAIYSGGATFDFEPIGNSNVTIFLEKFVLPDGSVRWVRGQEVGPFGNLTIDSNNFSNINPEWKELASMMVHEAYRAILWLEGFNPDYWRPVLKDFTDQAETEAEAETQPEHEGGESNEEVTETKTNTTADQSDDN